MLRARSAALAAILLTAPAMAVQPTRLDALFRTRPETLGDMVRARLEGEAKPAETAATVYVLNTETDEAKVYELGEHEVRMAPWFRPPNWFAAVRFADKRFGVQEAFPSGDIEMSGPFGGELTEGVYEDAQAFAHQDEGRNGLSVRGACESDGGRFEIIELNYDYVGHVDRFGATFETPGCRGFVVFRRGLNDWTGQVDNGAPSFPVPPEVPPNLPEVIAEFAADDPQLADLEMPEDPSAPHMTVYATGEDWVARGRKILMQGDGPEVRWNNGWSPEKRVVDLKLRKPRPDGFVDWFEVVLMSPLQEEIRPRIYPYAGNFPYQAAGYPGIRVAGLANGCATTSGIFEVMELKRAEDDRLLRYAARFEQHCEGYGPPMRGFVVYRAP